MAVDGGPPGNEAGMHGWLGGLGAGSAFGTPAHWPAALRTLLGLMRRSGLPTLVAWGTDLRLVYNDAFIPVVGARHPGAFGARMQDVWTEGWAAMEAAVRRVLGGGSSTLDHWPAPATGDAASSRRWFSLSFTPAYGEDGAIVGVVGVATETTDHVALERRNAFELLLADGLRSLSAPAEVAQEACRLLGAHLGAGRVSFVEVAEPAGGKVRVLRDWTAGELPSQAGRELPLDEFGAKAFAQLRAGRVVRVNDFDHESATERGGGGELVDAATRSTLAVPLFRGGRLAAILQVDGTSARAWSEADVAIVTEVAERSWSALDAAAAEERRRHAERELHHSAARQAFQLELADLLRPLSEPEAIVAAASALLGRHLGVSRVLYAEVDDEAGSFRVRSDWTDGQARSVAGVRARLDQFGPEMIEGLRRGESVVVGDVAADPRTAPHRHAYEAGDVRALALLPLLRAGRLSIVLNLHQSRPRGWREVDLQRARDMAERTWLALEAARAHAALRAERDQSRYVLDTIAEGFLLLDRNGRIAQINPEGLRLAQVGTGSAVGRSVWDVWPGAREGGVRDLHEQVVRTGQPATMEFRCPTAPGPGSWLEVRTFPALDGGVAVFVRDIGERKQAEERLREADRRKDEFLATLAHELRNPLAPIAAAAQVLSMPGLQPADIRRTGEVIARQAGHISRLVNELLDVSRVTRGAVALHRERLDLREVVPEALEQVEPLLRARRHELLRRIGPDPLPVRADRQRLVQVLANLLTNAGKYTPAGGRIELVLAAEGGDAVLALRDNGIGMTPELVATAFELFTQAERSGDHLHGGLGIGLALVRAIVELHGGSVTARSDGLGRGSEFVVRLPLAA